MPENTSTTRPTESGKKDLQKSRSRITAGQSIHAERFRGLNQKAAAVLSGAGSQPGSDPKISPSSAPITRPRLIPLHPQMVTRRSPLQTRQPFDPIQNLEDSEFTRSVKQHGVIQPILVYRLEGDGSQETEYGLISGHRRLDAALYNNLTSIPALLIPPETSGENRDILTLLDNLQRKDLQPVEKAAQIRRLMDTYGYTNREAAELVGLSESHVSSLLSLLNAPPEVQEAVNTGKLGVRNARKVIQMSEPERRQVLDLTRDGLTLTDALREVSANPETALEGENVGERVQIGGDLETPAVTRERDESRVENKLPLQPGKEASNSLGWVLGEQNDEFEQALQDNSLVKLVPPNNYLLMAIIWLANDSNIHQALSRYQNLTNAAKSELEKAISSIYKLSVLPRRARDASGADLARVYLSMAIQILLGR